MSVRTIQQRWEAHVKGMAANKLPAAVMEVARICYYAAWGDAFKLLNEEIPFIEPDEAAHQALMKLDREATELIRAEIGKLRN